MRGMPNGSRTFCAECGAKRPAKDCVQIGTAVADGANSVTSIVEYLKTL